MYNPQRVCTWFRLEKMLLAWLSGKISQRDRAVIHPKTFFSPLLPEVYLWVHLQPHVVLDLLFFKKEMLCFNFTILELCKPPSDSCLTFELWAKLYLSEKKVVSSESPVNSGGSQSEQAA